MRKQHLLIKLLLLAIMLVGTMSVWAQVSTVAPVSGSSYVVAVYANSKYYALPNTTTNGGTLSGTEVTVNASGKVTTENAPTWTFTAGTTTGEYYLSYTSGSNTYYLYKNGTGKSNVNFKVSTGNQNYWAFTANGTAYNAKAVDRGDNNLYIGVSGTTFQCSATAASIILLELAGAETSTDPSITTSGVNLAAEATSGIINYNINNPVEGKTLTANSETSWISNVTVDTENSKVTFSTTANTGDAREGVITLSYKYGDGEDDIATADVAVKQAKPVVTTTYTLATAVIPGKHYVIASGKNGSIYAMGAQASNNRSCVAITADNGTLSIADDAQVCEMLIRADEASGHYTIFDEAYNSSAGGYLYAAQGTGTGNYMRTEGELDEDGNGTWTISIADDGVATIKATNTSITRVNMRFNNGTSKLFSCYASGQSDIYLFERDGDMGSQTVSALIAEACTDGSKYYGTYSNPFSFEVPEGVTVAEIGISDGKLNVQEYAAGAKVPANTGVMISSTTAGSKSLTLTSGGTSKMGDSNCLRATGVAGITASEMAAADTNSLFYRLTMHNGTQIGFWWGAEDGAAFTLAANKAYLAVPKTGSAPQSFSFGDMTTDIMDNKRETITSNSYYNLNGQRVSQPTKGLYIVNGKKIIIK